ncbi:DUF1972 domain-containing protein [Pedobacter chinensis]|uniref:DUF1972 domain-containing protein n=1 Tax=Pedobacter chinensis TaxID=2282421 RepID=A0A369PNV0_9SPHI|nr:DUF1972 domain-containing protein [Pedobacter chinensis]RDC54281.1 DUF1972 domain-containing protein [Pedobacter chinensis]
MKIAIIGTRGIPDFYRGFEKSAQFIALGLVDKGHEVMVYSSHNHSYQKSEWCGINLIHVYDPEYKMGVTGNFIYDLNCVRDVITRNCDLIIQFGCSSSIWSWLLAKKSKLISNIATIEWKRNRYHGLTSTFLRLAESTAVRYSHSLISDSENITQYLTGKYQKRARFIPQGVDLFTNPSNDILGFNQLKPFNYDLYIGSLEPDNGIEQILDGVATAKMERPFIVIGGHTHEFGKYLKFKYKNDTHIKFLGSMYDPAKLNNLRYFSNLYFYGDAGGGTTHLILEAMAASCLISAYDHPANRQILGSDSFYFTSSTDVTRQLLSTENKMVNYRNKIDNNIGKLTEVYNWQNAINQFHDHLKSLFVKRMILQHNDPGVSNRYHVIPNK